MSHPLDNPAWHALIGPQRQFGRVGKLAARYLPSISPIAAVMQESDAAFADLAALTAPGEIVAVITDRLLPDRDWQTVAVVHLSQWLHSGKVVAPAADASIETLGEADAAAMYALARLTDPGPFEKDTWRLGTYLGVRSGDALVAMAGERMRLPGYAEVSAVATHPANVGHRYASRLVHAVLARQADAGEQSFLHVRTGSPSEAAASRVYHNLGYRVRHRSTFHVGQRRS